MKLQIALDDVTLEGALELVKRSEIILILLRSAHLLYTNMECRLSGL